MIDLATAKAHLKVETTDEDALITAYLAAAKAAVQGASAKFLAPTEVTQTEDGFPRSASGDKPLRLWYGPVFGEAAIGSIAYDDGNGDEQLLADFRLVEGDNAKLLPAFGACWPATINGQATVRVTYTPGYATDEDVPDALDLAVLLLTAHFYANREAVNSGAAAAAVELPLGVEYLIKPFRTPRLG
jgi:uncharacterized phiE125 gp8 family phage protein